MINWRCFLKAIFILNQLVSIFAQTSILTTAVPISSIELISSSNYTKNYTNSTQLLTTNKKNILKLNTLNLTTTTKKYFDSVLLNNSTTSTKIIKSLFYLTDFKLIKINYSKTINEFIIDYKINSNRSDFSQKPHDFKISLNCTSKDNQMWSNQIATMFTESMTLQASVNLKPLNNESLPKPGSFIRCTSLAESDINHLDSNIFYLFDPLPAVNLNLAKVDQTTLNLTWTNPEYYYDLINLNCASTTNDSNSHKIDTKNYSFNLTKTFQRPAAKESSFLLTNLIPGSNYTCWITTKKFVFNDSFSSLVESKPTHQTTDPSNLSIHNFKLNETNSSISFEFQPPFGFYDNFSISLVDLISNEIVYTQNYMASSAHDLLFIKSDLIPGKSYKIHSIVNRSADSSFKNLISFSLRPDPIQDIKIYALSKSKINVTWTVPVYFQLFMINTSLGTHLKTQSNWIQISDINTTNISLGVSTCSTKECDLTSKYLTSTFNFEALKIKNISEKLLDSNNLLLNFDLTDLYDFKSIRFELTNLETGLSQSCIYELKMDNKCSFSFSCVDSKCGLKLHNLKYNSNYQIIMTPISYSNYEFKSIDISFKTKPWLPDIDYQTYSSYAVQSKFGSSQVLNVYLPEIDETNGAVMDTNLLMVKLGTLKMFNHSDKFRIDNLRDQDYLKYLYYTTELCSNETVLTEPCLISKINDKQNKNTSVIYLIGNLGDKISIINSVNQSNTSSFTYEYISQDLIEPFNLYQLFFLFKIGDNQSELFLASSPTEPIQTNSKNSHTAGIKSRDGIALWAIIVLCTISCVFLIGLIAIIITLSILRRKPSKFQKAAQLNPNQHSFDPSTHSRSKYDDFLGSSDFVLPGEFSRNEMTNIWLVKHANGDLILDEEYRNLPDYRDFKTCYASQLMSNESKNRFLDIKAYDDSRVILDLCSQNNLSISTESISDYYSETDYINANFVQGYSHDKKFIATQGPKKETINDFWRMIYQYRVSAIVMLTKLVEKGVERCTQYWPDKLNMPEVYGDYELTLKDQQKCGDYVKRTFDLVKINNNKNTTMTTILNTPNSFTTRKILTVNQYYYPEWPDKDTPSTDPISILHLIRDVNRNHLTYQYPIVVHCSAGVGRTGTYITLDAMMEKINTEGKIDIFGFISKIRTRRQYLVQTSKQYIFIHEALYEYCLYGFTDIDVSHLVSYYKNSKESKQSGKRTKLEIEYEKLTTAFYPNSQAREAFSNDNKYRNRNLDCICYDENRIRLSNLNGSSYINATMVRGFEINNDLIITQDPMEHTEFEFWKMITEQECKIIVALNKNLENEFVYWPTDQQPIRNCECDCVKFVIQLVNSSNQERSLFNGMITRREFEIIEQKYSGTSKMYVTHFMLNEEWSEDRIPTNKVSILDLIGQVQKTGAKFDRSKVAVHAHGGGSNCSVFCALNILLYQFKNDQFIDVCRTVKKLKTQRPRMIETLEQYEFLYECLVEFVDMFGIYSQSTDSFNSKSSLNDSFNNLHSPSKNESHVKLNFS